MEVFQVEKEYDNRLQALQRYLQNENVDVAMITSPANVFYQLWARRPLPRGVHRVKPNE